MAPNVQFNEENSFRPPIPSARSVTFADYLIKTGIVSRKRDADMLLGLLAVILLFSAYYFIRLAVPPEPSLGADVLSPGEVVPEYVKQQ